MRRTRHHRTESFDLAFPLLVIVIATVILGSGAMLHVYNHSVATAPASLLDRLVPGVSTVDDFVRMAGSSVYKQHGCMGSTATACYRLRNGSPFVYRSIEVTVWYRGPNSGYGGRSPEVFDGDCRIQRIVTETFPKLNLHADRFLERWAAIAMDWEYQLWK